MPATRRLILFIIIILLLLLLFIVVPSVSWSQTPPPNPWQDPARELAKKIVAITGPRQTVTLAVRNISSLSDSEVAAVRLALDAELRAAGLRLAAKPDAAPELRITLSENVQGLLWIAEIPHDASSEVAMVSLPKTAAFPPTATTQMFVLHPKLIYQQDEPILDFGFAEPKSPSGARLFVVGRSQVETYIPNGSGWKLIQSAQLPHPMISSRDPIADLRINADSSFWLWLAGFVCRGGPQPSPQMTCSDIVMNRDSTSPQKSDFSPQIVQGRNFYRVPDFDTGGPGETLQYAEMWLKQDGRTVLVKIRLDGTAWILREVQSGASEATKSGWGSQLGVVESGCGKGMQLLVTAPGDWTAPDAIQAVEFDGLQPANVTAPLLMPGPVIKLNFDLPNGMAFAVVRNLNTNRYEAYTLTLSCGR